MYTLSNEPLLGETFQAALFVERKFPHLARQFSNSSSRLVEQSIRHLLKYSLMSPDEDTFTLCNNAVVSLPLTLVSSFLKFFANI